ncbi:MAG: FkbM family methyltransferase [Anaerolineales bacterium]|nr:FkbM family methyltransferase [Anaerolineales bacterium]
MSFAEFIYTEILKPKHLKAFTNAILLKIIPDQIQFGPATIYPDPEDPVLSGALIFNVFERSELTFFDSYCKGAMTVIDIGANIGCYTSLAIHSLNQNGQVVAFEPHPRAFSFLKRNIQANQEIHNNGPAVRTFQLAAADNTGTKQLRLNPENLCDNRLYHGTYQGKLENWEQIEVESLPVDTVLEQLEIKEVNFVKIDIQGYEYHAISGFRNILANSKQVILMSEFWPKGLTEAGSNPKEYLELLTSLGFTLYELKEKPLGKLVPLENQAALIKQLPGRKYTNIVGAKGYSLRLDK